MTDWPREVFIELDVDVRIRYARSDRPPLAWLLKLRERPSAEEPIQLPPRTRVEVRDASGLPIAA